MGRSGATSAARREVLKTMMKMKFPKKAKLEALAADGGIDVMAVENHEEFLQDMSCFYKIKDGSIELK